MANKPAVSVSGYERCCRICAQEQDVTLMIFGEESEAMHLQNKLNKYFMIEVYEEDKLPKNICIDCCTRVQSVCDFIDTARRAQEILYVRSIMLEQISEQDNSSSKSETLANDEGHVSGMEVSVDPMIVLQNSEESVTMTMAPNDNNITQDTITEETNFQSADGEYVTIKLIKKGSENPAEDNTPTSVDSVDTDILNENATLRKNFKPFACVTCKRGFLTELALKNHAWIHMNEDKQEPVKNYRCSKCGETFDFKSNLLSHLKDHRISGMCQLCGRVFRSETNLAAHMLLHMSTGKSFTCKVCGRSYNTQSNLTTHSITHSNERPFKCHICKKSFKRNQDLKFHLNQHTGEKPYKCPFCDKRFASSGNCYSHRNRMHPGRRQEARRRVVKPEKNEKLPNQPAKPTQPSKPIKLAPKPAPVMPLPVAKTALNKGIYKYQCHICSNTFIRRDNYTYHLYQHTGQKPFKCTLCNERYVTRRGLLIHHNKEHADRERPLGLLSKNVLLK